MADIFISYAKADRAVAGALARELQQRRWSVWWDRQIAVGLSWDQVIEEEIAKARAVIVLWSPNAVASDWVRNEARDAKRRGILVPVLIQSVKFPMEFTHIEAADLTEWQPGANEAEFDKVITALNRLIGEAPASEIGHPMTRSSQQNGGAATSADPDSVLNEFLTVAPPDTKGPFLLWIDDIFSIKGRGTVVSGQVERGRIVVGQAVEIVGFRGEIKTAVVGIELSRKLVDTAGPGDEVGVLLRNVPADQVQRGQVLAAPGSIAAHSRFDADVYLLTPEQGGADDVRRTGEPLQFALRTAVVSGALTVAKGKETLPSGKRLSVQARLDAPVPLERGVRFTLRDGEVTCGVGVVTFLPELKLDS